MNFLKDCLQQGADPGFCICNREQVNEDILRFGEEETKIVLQKQDAIDLARKNNLFLKEVGGSGDGIIGALAGVGLRRKGNSGRFIELRGIRNVHGLVSVGELEKCTGIDSVQDIQGNVLEKSEIIDSQDWI